MVCGKDFAKVYDAKWTSWEKNYDGNALKKPRKRPGRLLYLCRRKKS